jgi:hypothetical protein
MPVAFRKETFRGQLVALRASFGLAEGESIPREVTKRSYLFQIKRPVSYLGLSQARAPYGDSSDDGSIVLIFLYCAVKLGSGSGFTPRAFGLDSKYSTQQIMGSICLCACSPRYFLKWTHYATADSVNPGYMWRVYGDHREAMIGQRCQVRNTVLRLRAHQLPVPHLGSSILLWLDHIRSPPAP